MNQIGQIFLRCDDLAEMLVVDRTKWDYGDDDWNFSIQDSYIVKNYSVLRRIKRALKVLFGKPVYYADVCVSDVNKIIEFRDKLTELIEKGN